ncbi:MAG: mannose-6-phosphate isomerase, class I, partial [Spirochaetaceae bacterium]|nr:mannose-6-phosphate isomerase, class I [Spirochaetaceae bacterium]
MNGIYKIEGSIKEYEWGSADMIPSLLGIPNSESRPLAELWLGAHPAGTSLVSETGGGLDALIAHNSSFFLGSGAAEGEGRLSFLLKILAAEKPLSIQAHPNKAQAASGYAKENALGIPANSPLRCYKDANDKPEILCAQSPFTALCGFRPIAEIQKLFAAFSCPAADSLMRVLQKDAHQSDIYKSFIHSLSVMPADGCAAVTEHISHNESGLIGRHAEYAPVWKLTADLARRYPEDGAVLAPLFLNEVSLNPGDAFFVPAGVLHAYIHGLGIELMAASDNVLRGGLTTKHIDYGELLRILRPEPYTPPVEQGGAASYQYRCGEAAGLCLSRIVLSGETAANTTAAGASETAIPHLAERARDRGSCKTSVFNCQHTREVFWKPLGGQ